MSHVHTLCSCRRGKYRILEVMGDAVEEVCPKAVVVSFVANAMAERVAKTEGMTTSLRAAAQRNAKIRISEGWLICESSRAERMRLL